MSDLAGGAALGKYEIRGVLGKGAMGTVYDGWDPVIERRVAIKTIALSDTNDPDIREGLDRFKREAQAAGRLSHPNIVAVYDYGEAAGCAFMVMEFVEGHTLRAMLEAGELADLPGKLRVTEDILLGLSYSHARGVVHRDIKPANVMITAQGSAKIADFGIARIESSSLTQAGTMMGTPAYMSPEQFVGQAIDHRTDIYSCGVLLYQLLTGERPFEGSLTSIMHKVLNNVPARPSELSVAAPRGLDAVVARALARRPEDRFATAEDFAKALRQAALSPELDDAGEATIVAAPVTPAAAKPGNSPPAGSRKAVYLGGGGAALAVAAVAAWLTFSPAAAPPVFHTLDQAMPVAPAKTIPPNPMMDTVVRQAASTKPGGGDVQSVTVRPSEPPPPEAKAVIPPPPRPPPPARPASLIRRSLAAALPELHCSLAAVDVAEAGDAVITGLVGSGDPEAALRAAVAKAEPAAAEWRLATFSAPYCHALDLLRPLALTPTHLALKMWLGLSGGATVLSDNQVMPVDVTMPDFGGHLFLDYLQSDGTVDHLVPGADNPDRTYGAGEHVELGRSRGAFPGFTIGPPFGTDMVVAIVSTAPLFARSRPVSEPTEDYLRDLTGAIDALRRRGGILAAAAVVLETRP